jgi:hypothetical protein
MLTTIFTGHTLDLRDIVAVGPIMQEKDGEDACMFIKIYLQHQIVIKHVHHKTFLRLFNEKETAKLWDIRLEDIMAKRDELVQEWQLARYPSSVTDDTRAKYTMRILADMKGGEE